MFNKAGQTSGGEIQCRECKKYGHIAIACPDRQSAWEKVASKPVMVATQDLRKQLTLHNGLLDGQAVQVLLDTGSETSIARTSLVDPTKHSKQMVKVKCVHGDIFSYPSAMVDLRMNDGWEGKIRVALVPDVPIDVVIAWGDLGPATELNSLDTTRAQRRQQLQEKERADEVEATPNSSPFQFAKDPGVEGEGVDSPHVHQARGPVNKCPDRQEGGNGPAIGGGLHPSKTPSVVPDAHTLADILQVTRGTGNKQIQRYRKSES